MRISFFLIVLLISGCKIDERHNKTKSDQLENYFVLQGNLKNSFARSLFLEEITPSIFLPLDTIPTDNDGGFLSVLPFKSPAFYALRNITGDLIIIFPSLFDTINIIADYNDFSDYNLSGNHQSKEIAALHSASRVFMENINEIARITKDSLESDNYPPLKKKLSMRYDSLLNRFKNYSFDFIEKNMESPIALLALQNQIGRNTYVFDIQNDFVIYSKVDSVLFSLYPEFPAIKELHDRLNVIRTQLASRTKNTKLLPGMAAPEISLPDTSGKTRELSGLKGKIVLVDFWGSWSPASRRRNSELLNLYSKWQDSNFEIFQVAIEKDLYSWVKAINQDTLSWINVSDLSFWNSSICEKYGIIALPSSFLVNQEGLITAINPEISELNQILASLLN